MITSSFDTTKPLVNLKDFYGEKRHLVDKCLIILSVELYNYMLKHFAVTEIARVKFCCGDTIVYRFNYENETMAFYLSFIGATLAGSTITEVNWLTGATKFIMFGSCGSLNHEITKGKYIIPTKAYRDEGMSYHFMSPSDYITLANNDQLATIFTELNVPFVRGPIWTTDAMLRETYGQVTKRKEEGCIAVEMEISGVEAVSQFYGFKLHTFLQAGDIIYDDGYDPTGLGNANHDIDKLLIALKALKKL